MTSLVELEAEIRRRLALFDYPMRDWMVADPTTDYDVVIVGTGKRALTLALALQRERIHRVALIATPHPDTLCRDAELSTGAGPARADFATHGLSLPLLSFESWQRRLGRGGEWAEYLLWYRRFVVAPVLENVALVTLPGGPDQRLSAGGKAVSTRRLVIATDADSLVPTALPAPHHTPPGAMLAFVAAADCLTSRFFELLDDSQKPMPVYLFGTKALAGVGPAAMADNLVRYGVPRVLAGISRSLFLEDQDTLYKIFQEFETAEVLGGKLAGS